MDAPLPPGWTTVQLNTLLTQKQQKEINDLLQGNPTDKQVPALKAYLRPLSTELEKKGVVADYLAYWLYAKHNNII